MVVFQWERLTVTDLAFIAVMDHLDSSLSFPALVALLDRLVVGGVAWRPLSHWKLIVDQFVAEAPGAIAACCNPQGLLPGSKVGEALAPYQAPAPTSLS